MLQIRKGLGRAKVSFRPEPGGTVFEITGECGGEPAISAIGLRMSYANYEAVRGIDLEVARGEILAFLGPNGAGKTATTEILGPLATAMQAAPAPATNNGHQFAWQDLLIVIAWGVAGTLFALRRFSWSPSRT